MVKLEVARGRPRVFYGWWIVLAAAAINVYGSGVWFYGFPVFFRALLVEFPMWGRGVAAGAVSFSRLEGGLEAPIVGWLVDKFGPRRLAAIGACIAGFGFMVMSVVSDVSVLGVHISALVVFYLVYGGLISIGYNTGFGHAAMAAVANWFVKYRSRAFALWSLGAGLSGVTVALLGVVVAANGWRFAAFMAGVGMFVIVLPLTTVLRHKPEQYGYLPDGAAPGEEAPPTTADVNDEPVGARAPEYDFTVKEALLTSAFWMLVLASTVRSVSMTSVVIHEVAYFTDVGIPEVQASAALGAMVFISLVGRLAMGGLGDIVDKRYVLILAYVLQAGGIYLLGRVTSMSDVWLFVVVYGIGYGGAIPVFMAIVGDYYGRRYYATIRGFMQFFLIPASVFGPIYAGLVYDWTKSYQFAFTSFIVALLVGTVFLFVMKRPVPAQARQAA